MSSAPRLAPRPAARGARAPRAATDEVLVLDFGGQYSQLIARRIRECGVFSELLPHDVARGAARAARRAGSSSPAARRRSTRRARRALRPELLELGMPVLGICYGMQAMARELGGRVEGAEVGEFGRTELQVASRAACWPGFRPSRAAG